MRATYIGFVATVLNLIVIAGCGSAVGSLTTVPSASSPPGTASTAAAPASRGPDPTIAIAPRVTESSLPSACLPMPHDAPELEKQVPTMIAGRPLAIWSVHGARMITCISGGTASDVADLAAALAADGLSLDDLSVVIAGRTDVATDPPYFILAYNLAGHPGSEFPSTVSIDHPDAVAFHEADLEGKHVLVGEMAGMDQSDHSRGRPYVWNSPTTHYLIVTDDERWAAEVLRALR